MKAFIYDYFHLKKGSFSTPLLHRIGTEINKQVVSIDTQLDWVNKFAFYRLTPNHKILFMTPAEMDIYGLEKKWGMVLVDHGIAGTRYLNMIKFSQLANIVIGIHFFKLFCLLQFTYTSFSYFKISTRCRKAR